MPERWIGDELERGLAPVAAPDELWERVAQPRRDAGRKIDWTLAAAAMLLVAAGTFWRFEAAGRDAGEALARAARRDAGNPALDIHTASCAELHDWLKRRTGLDVPLPEHTRAGLEGARQIEYRGRRMAAIVFRTAGEAATLFVGQGDTGRRHPEMQMASLGGATARSWSLGGNVYLLAGPESGDPSAGCRLCHAR